MRKFITKAEFLNKKEKANRALELANFEKEIAKQCSSKKTSKTALNYNSPNVRERLGWCKTY